MMHNPRFKPLFPDDEKKPEPKPQKPSPFARYHGALFTPPPTHTVAFFPSPSSDSPNFPSQDARNSSNSSQTTLNPSPQSPTPKKCKKTRKTEKIAVHVRTVQKAPSKSLNRSLPLAFRSQTQNIQLKREEQKTPIKGAEPPNDLPILNDEMEDSENVEVEKVTEKKIPADFKPYGTKKVFSLEADLGINPPSPRQKLPRHIGTPVKAIGFPEPAPRAPIPAPRARAAQGAQGAPKPPPPAPSKTWQEKYAEILQIMNKRALEEDAKRKVYMFLPTAFANSNMNASDVKMLYGRFRVMEVIPFFDRNCEPLGFGLMQVFMEKQTEIVKWAHRHPWRAYKMMVLRNRRTETSSIIHLVIRNLSKLGDMQLEGILKQHFHATFTQLCYNSAGTSTRTIDVEMKYEDAVSLRARVDSRAHFSDNDEFHKLKVLEVVRHNTE